MNDRLRYFNVVPRTGRVLVCAAGLRGNPERRRDASACRCHPPDQNLVDVIVFDQRIAAGHGEPARILR